MPAPARVTPSIAAVWTATAASAVAAGPLAPVSPADEDAKQRGIIAGRIKNTPPFAGATRKNPTNRPTLPRLHADAHTVPVAVKLVVNGPSDQQKTGRDLYRALVHENACRDEGSGHHRDRNGVAEGDWRQRQQNRGSALSMQAERHGEQPAHGRV